MKKFNKLWEIVQKLKLLFFLYEDLVEDIEFSLSGNKKLLTKDLHHFRLLGKYYFNFITSFN